MNLTKAPEGVTREGFVSWLVNQDWPRMWGFDNDQFPHCPLCASVSFFKDVHAQWHADEMGLE